MVPNAGNDKDFRNSLKDFESFIEELSQLVIERDPTIPELPKKDIVRFRSLKLSKLMTISGISYLSGREVLSRSDPLQGLSLLSVSM